ncbi:MAG TPA: peptidoglycan-binding protein [Alphaproteobacteria bacterium]|nr:peptidoglycan-binding protein [Micavibrio sp.]MBK9561745.1 peptidoglycan-binding protein [Micavibrio sp.]HQX26614.1 peptidoglycan-binding protein [Alphaproteobacteria bacterium]
MFTLLKRIARDVSTELEDTAIVKFALTSLGYYDDKDTGMSPYADDGLFHSIKTFQKKNGLKVDGIINPDGPTQSKMKENLQSNKKAENAFGDFWNNYKDMRDANTIGADRYFHCKANYEATKRGWDGFAAAGFLSNMREAGNLVIDPIKKGQFPVKDVIDDQHANKYGRNSARSGQFSSAREACAIYRPAGLDDKY